MRVNDTVIGAVLLLLSLLVFWTTLSFSAIPGQPYGAGLFPRTVSTGLAIVSVVLIVQGLRSGARLLQIEATTGNRLLAFAITVGSLFFYVFFSDALGFIICSTLMLIALLWSYGVRPVLLLPLSIGSTLVIHTGFYKLLHVPLPWGVLERFAW